MKYSKYLKCSIGSVLMWRGLANILEQKDEMYTQALYNITYPIVTSL